jgi:hypothetical protein
MAHLALLTSLTNEGLARGSNRTMGDQIQSAMDDHAENVTQGHAKHKLRHAELNQIKIRWRTNRNFRPAAFGHRHCSEPTHMVYEQNPNKE